MVLWLDYLRFGRRSATEAMPFRLQCIRILFINTVFHYFLVSYLSVNSPGEVDAGSLAARQGRSSLSNERLISVRKLLEVLLEGTHSHHLENENLI